MWGSITTAAVVVILAAVSSAIWVAVIGGVFLVISQLATLWLSRTLDRREHEGTLQDRRHPGRNGNRRRRRTDREPDDPR